MNLKAYIFIKNLSNLLTFSEEYGMISYIKAKTSHFDIFFLNFGMKRCFFGISERTPEIKKGGVHDDAYKTHR